MITAEEARRLCAIPTFKEECVRVLHSVNSTIERRAKTYDNAVCLVPQNEELKVFLKKDLISRGFTAEYDVGGVENCFLTVRW